MKVTSKQVSEFERFLSDYRSRLSGYDDNQLKVQLFKQALANSPESLQLIKNMIKEIEENE